jgi:hypothetical protein
MKEKPVTLPSITELARLIASTEKGLFDGEGGHNRSRHADALRHLIATMPPQNLADAAVLVAESATLAWEVDGSTDLAELQSAADRVQHMLLRALPIVATAAGLDYPRELAWKTLEARRADLDAG